MLIWPRPGGPSRHASLPDVLRLMLATSNFLSADVAMPRKLLACVESACAVAQPMKTGLANIAVSAAARTQRPRRPNGFGRSFRTMSSIRALRSALVMPVACPGDAHQ
jgi:hypothetical protein